ncbi:MAG TPA: hypothetical protein VHE54_19245, partial [Puia sp.]|nr:hypothetical protein [Puia sp.]
MGFANLGFIGKKATGNKWQWSTLIRKLFQMVKQFFTVVTLSFFSVAMVRAQGSLLDRAKNAAHSLKGGKGLSSEDIVAGLKDALNHGTQKSTDK